MQPIKLVAIDLDGTLLRGDHTPHPEVAIAIEEARSTGIEVVIASGRSIQSIDRVIAPFIPVHAAVASNGADVWSPNRANVHQSLLSHEVKQTVLEFAATRELHLSCYTPQGTVANRDSAFLTEYRTLIQGLEVPVYSYDTILNSDIFKLVFIADAGVIPELRVEIEALLSGQEVEITESAPRYLEILPRGTNKGTGLLHLCRSLEIDMGHVAAIGDYRNDLEMLQLAGLPAAVANALPEVKDLAKVVVPSNEEGGVAQFIREFVLKR